MRMVLHWVPRFAIFWAVVLAIFFLSSATVQAAGRMPEFRLAAVNGKEQVESAKLKGQVLLINFFATWCQPCRYEIPSLISVQEQFGTHGFSVIGLSLDLGEVSMVGNFVENMKVNYPVAMGNPEVARGFGGLIGIPTSFLVDRKGNIVKTYPGYTAREVFEQDIKELL